MEYATEREVGDGLTVIFYGIPSCQNDSFSYSYGSINAVEKSEDYWICEDITWEKHLYTPDQNALIEAYLNDHLLSIEKCISEQAEEIDY